MKKNKLAVCFTVFCLVLMHGITPLMAGEKKLNLKMAAFFSKQSPAFEVMYEWPARMIEKATKGRAKVTIYPSNSLVPIKDVYRAVQEGIVDVTWVWGPATPGAFPLTELFSLPGFSANQATSNLVVNELFRLYPDFERQFSSKVKHIATQVHMRSDLHSTEPIRSLSDLKGKVIACQNDKVARAMSRLGASATQMQIPDMYTAVERGVVKGTVQAWGSFAVNHMYEVLKYHTLIGVGTGTSHWMWCRKTWEKFTSEEQAKLELLGPWFQNYIATGNVAMSRGSREKYVTPEKGHEFIVWSEKDMKQMKKLFRPIWDEWAKRMETKGYPGHKILKDAENLMGVYNRD
ncbi:MAG: TRAP transporter substrate-binding protein DctP [Deltaproteobacteria bacterium]|nr:TRAP transporter substrate-binding protein DctP [Deltaproteobacteria bacterium]